MGDNSPLGRNTGYDHAYSRDLLHPIPRAENRHLLGLTGTLPFRGEDIWNAYELSWLDSKKKPRVAVAEFHVPFDSPNIIESKSMKLYLNSCSMTVFGQADDITATIAADLAQTAGKQVTVRLHAVSGAAVLGHLPGDCIDDLDVECRLSGIDPGQLGCKSDHVVSESLHSHLLRSVCPVTGQPDSGSILIRYRGRRIDRGGLLRYLVSYRNHSDYHESCVERIFVDLKKHCAPEGLTVYARYNRRGGIDINPFRSDFEASTENIRLWRQ